MIRPIYLFLTIATQHSSELPRRRFLHLLKSQPTEELSDTRSLLLQQNFFSS